MSVALSIFRDAKLDELVNVYSKAPDTERTKAYDIPSLYILPSSRGLTKSRIRSNKKIIAPPDRSEPLTESLNKC